MSNKWRVQSKFSDHGSTSQAGPLKLITLSTADVFFVPLDEGCRTPARRSKINPIFDIAVIGKDLKDSVDER